MLAGAISQMQSELTRRESGRGLRVFLAIWFGQFVSVIGSGLSAFALGVWVYQATGSATGFALISLCSSLPAIVASPFSGMLVDHWDRRSAMILADAGAALSILAVAVLLIAGSLEVWQICLAVALLSVFTSAQLPAYSASATMLVPRRHLGRVGGLMQVGEATAQIIVPALGGVLTLAIGLQGVLLIDVSTFLFAIITLLSVRFPKLEATAERQSPQGLSLSNALYGWKYIQRTPGLLALMLFFAACNLFVGIISVLITPFILSSASPAALGTVLSTGGIGMLAGSLVMTTWGGPKRPLQGVFGFNLVFGFFCILAGLSSSVVIIAVSSFFCFFSLPITYGSGQAIWQIKVSPDAQGRVFAARSMTGWVSLSLAYLVAGPLADLVFEPALVTDGPLADSIGLITGTGPGRGIGMIFAVIGILMVLLVVVARSRRDLRAINNEVSLSAGR